MKETAILHGNLFVDYTLDEMPGNFNSEFNTNSICMFFLLKKHEGDGT